LKLRTIPFFPRTGEMLIPIAALTGLATLKVR
jgi:hypothetical protein